MGTKPHPLDVFRSTPQGFDSATTDPSVRRTVEGKVLTTTRRQESEAGNEPKGPRRVQAARPATTASVIPPRRPARSRAGYGTKLLWTALGIIVVVVGYVWLLGPGDDGPTPLKSVDKIEAPVEHAPLTPAAGGAVDYTIQLSTYNGNETGVDIAQAAQQEMQARGFSAVEVLGFPDEGGGFAHVALTVGKASRADDLAGLLAAVRGIDDWGSGKNARPFADAHIIQIGH